MRPHGGALCVFHHGGSAMVGASDNSKRKHGVSLRREGRRLSGLKTKQIQERGEILKRASGTVKKKLSDKKSMMSAGLEPATLACKINFVPYGLRYADLCILSCGI